VISETTIQQAVEHIVASVHPKRVILFGSYAQAELTRAPIWTSW